MSKANSSRIFEAVLLILFPLGGYLDGYNFKSFFGVAGEPGSFKWLKGQERVPEDWYRRPSYAPYEAQDVVGDVAIGYLAVSPSRSFIPCFFADLLISTPTPSNSAETSER